MCESLFGLAEIILSRKASASAVLLPFMLDQAAAGHKIHHVVDGSSGDRACVGTGHRRWPTARLRPEAVQDESIVPSNSTLGRVVGGMARTIVRCPRKREQVIVKLACGWFGFVVVMVMFGESEGSKAEKRTEQNRGNNALAADLSGN
jgi:hypothetical protein